VRTGAECWILHPRSGRRPIAEGIAGSVPLPKNGGDESGPSELKQLYDEGRQLVKVTAMFKKHIELFFPEESAGSKYLDDYVVPPAPHDTNVVWCRRYLSDKSLRL